MPFTPLHIGPGMAVKAIAQDKFSLIIFGWAQILVDLQPLVVVLTHEGQIHGVTHTFVGGAVLGAAAAASGKPMADALLNLFRKKEKPRIRISWKIACWSGLVGGLSHVLLDALIYPDMSPFWPFVQSSPLDIFTSRGMTAFCIFSGLAGLLVYFISRGVEKLSRHNSGDIS
jgi:membrane-bound metal-dependent hydrolase YbcI (DUF457 family)